MSNIRNNIENQIDDLIAEDDDFNGVEDLSLDNNDGQDDGEDGQEQIEAPASAQSGEATLEAPKAKEGAGQVDPNAPKRVGGDLVDAKGNVVDKEGKIIAAAGAERRHFVEARKATAEAANLRMEVTKLRTTLDQAKDFAELPQRLGITPDDYRDALQLAKQFSLDPVAAAKEVVARALALGHNVTDILGAEVGNSIDMVALRRMHDEQATRPAREQAETQRRQAEIQEAGARAYNEFVSKFPDSSPHEDAIANLVNQGETAEVAYFKIRNFALENGLDFSQPLGPQINARAAQNMQSGSQPKPANTRRPMPNGNGGRTPDNRMTDQSTYADADADFASIIRNVMGQ